MQDNRAQLAARPRTITGKKTRFLRREGWVPANIYGNGIESRAIQLDTKEIEHMLTHVPHNALVSIQLGGAPMTVLVKNVARKPTTGELYHVDFYQVSMTQTLRSTVPLVFQGEAPAVKLQSATILRGLDTIDVECLPGDLPTQISVDIERLAAIDDAILVRDLDVSPKVTILTPADELVVKALAPSVEAAPEAAAEEETAEAPTAAQPVVEESESAATEA